jgi:hypothetical protein
MFDGDFTVVRNHKTYWGLNVKWPTFLSDFKGIWSFSTNFRNSSQHQISRETTTGSHADIRRQTDMKTVIGSFCDYANASNKKKGKAKSTLVQALRLCTGPTAHTGSGGIALPFHGQGTRRWWGVSVRPGRSLPPGKSRYPLYGRLGGPQGRSGQVRKISPPPRFDPRTVQPVVSLYTDWVTRPTRTCLILGTILLVVTYNFIPNQFCTRISLTFYVS